MISESSRKPYLRGQNSKPLSRNLGEEKKKKIMGALGRISWLSSSVLSPPFESDNASWAPPCNLLMLTRKTLRLSKISCTLPESEIKDNSPSNGNSGSSRSKMDEYNLAMKTMMRNPYEYYHDLGMNYTLITEELIVGSQPQSPEDIEHLKEQQNVAYILNLQQDKDVEYWGIDLPSIVKKCKQLGIHHMRRPARDFDPESLRSILPKAVSLLDWAIGERKGRVYVHCTAGLGRAPAIAIAYMFWFSDMDLNTAYDKLTSKRPCGPNKRAIRGATYDLAKDDPWKEPFDSLPDYAFENIADWERKLIQHRVRTLRSTSE